MDWFRHDTDARNDIKLRKLSRDVGLAGIGAFWIVAEVLFEHGGVSPRQEVLDELEFYGDSGLLDKLVQYNLVTVNGDTISSHRVSEEIAFQDEARQKKSDAGKKGMASRWGNRVITADNTVITEDNKGYQAITDDNTLPNHTLPNIIPPSVSKDTSSPQGESVETEKVQNRKFRKPTIDEVKDYCRERKNNVDAETFVDFYESKGWKVGNQAMKDWKAAVRTWEKGSVRPSVTSQKTNKHKDYSDVKPEDFDMKNFNWGV